MAGGSATRRGWRRRLAPRRGLPWAGLTPRQRRRTIGPVPPGSIEGISRPSFEMRSNERRAADRNLAPASSGSPGSPRPSRQTRARRGCASAQSSRLDIHASTPPAGFRGSRQTAGSRCPGPSRRATTARKATRWARTSRQFPERPCDTLQASCRAAQPALS